MTCTLKSTQIDNICFIHNKDSNVPAYIINKDVSTLTETDIPEEVICLIPKINDFLYDPEIIDYHKSWYDSFNDNKTKYTEYYISVIKLYNNTCIDDILAVEIQVIKYEYQLRITAY